MPSGQEFIAIELLGRGRSGVAEGSHADEAPDERGLAYPAEPHELRLDDGRWLGHEWFRWGTRAVTSSLGFGHGRQ